MNYYYDVLINMNEDKCLKFYEWDNNDVIEYVKKIPLYRVNTKTLTDFCSYKIKVQKEFLDLLLDRTIIKNNKLSHTIKYACILCDTKNSVVVEFNDQGNIIAMSNLLLDDEQNILEFIYNYKEIKINYQKIAKKSINNTLPQAERIKRIIKIETNNLLENKNIEKLKYLFYEWFSYIEDDPKKIKEVILSELNKEVNHEMEKIASLIKLSYQQIKK